MDAAAAPAKPASLTLVPLHPTVGVESKGVHLAHELSPETTAALRCALDDHSAILLRGQQLTPEQFTRFSRGFGDLKTHTRPDTIYKHRWRVGDVLVWDNCSTQHVAIGDYALPQRRKLWKATIHGDTPA